MSRPENLITRNYSRREFLQLGAIVAAALTLPEIQNATSVLLEQKRDLDISGLDNASFINSNLDNLKGIRMGCTFRVEKFGITLANYQTEEGQKAQEEALKSLDFAHRKLGVNDVRIPIWWNNVVDENGNFDFGVYKPLFDYCKTNGIKTTAGIGLKGAGWPETHVPDSIVRRLKRIPPPDYTISFSSELGQESLENSAKLLDYLSKNYDLDELVIQTENEAFNSFGEPNWSMTEDYMNTLIDISAGYFPNAPILLNYSGSQDIGKIRNVLFKQISLGRKIIIGASYYPFGPGNMVLPGLGITDDMMIDGISKAKMLGRDYYKQNVQDSRRLKFGLQATELGTEPWEVSPDDPKQKFAILPGNSSKAFRFTVLRAAKYIVDNKADGNVLGIWGGIEDLTRRYFNGTITDEQIEILDLTRRINILNPRPTYSRNAA